MPALIPTPGARVAPRDGSPVYIGYGGERIVSPDGAHATVWTYETEKPHSDSLNSVMLDGLSIPGTFWGRGHAWSPNSAYFTLESYSGAGSMLHVVRVADRMWTTVAKNATTVSFVYPHLLLRGYGQGDDGVQQRFSFTEHVKWATWAPLAAT